MEKNLESEHPGSLIRGHEILGKILNSLNLCFFSHLEIIICVLLLTVTCCDTIYINMLYRH